MKKIRYEVCGLEEYDYPEDTCDLVISNLVLHYIEDLEDVYRKVRRILKKGGCFLFNIEHPVLRRGSGRTGFTMRTGSRCTGRLITIITQGSG